MDAKVIVVSSKKYGDFDVLVDEDDYDRLINKKLHIRKCYNQRYDCFYVGLKLDGKDVLLHRFIMGIHNGSSDIFTDHINGNKLDNRKSNLRLCTREENSRNLKLHKNNSSGRRGVTWYSHYNLNKWMAYIHAEGKNITLGYFEEFVDACNARREAELKYYGEFSTDVDCELKQ